MLKFTIYSPIAETAPMRRQPHLLKTTAPVLLALLSTQAYAATAPDAGQTLRDLRPIPAPSAQTSPALTLPTEAPSSERSSAGSDLRVKVGVLRYRGNTVFDHVVLDRVVGKLSPELSLAELRAATQRITTFYRSRGYLLARAYLPEQDISSGTVTIAILEGRLDHINLNNQSKLSTPQLQALLDAQQPSDQPVRSDRANRALLLLQALPGVGQVQGSLHPSATVGSTELNVDVTAGPWISGYVGLDNGGNRFTGADRLNGGVNLNNLTGFGDQLSLQAVVTNQDRMDYGRIAWDAPVGTEGLRLGAAFSNLRYHLGDNFARLDAHGIARTESVYADLAVIAAPDTHLNLNATLENRDMTDITGLVHLHNKRNIHVAVINVSGDFRDALLWSPAVNAWRVTTTVGDLDLRTKNVAAIDHISAQTAGNYTKVVLSATREQILPWGLSVYVGSTLQRSEKNLDSSEQFTLGGPTGIRAYPVGEAPGDQGWVSNIELRYRVMPELQLVAFHDLGAVEANRYTYIHQQNGTHLSGSGIGANATWRSFSLKTSLAWRGGSDAPTSDNDRRPRVFAQGSYTF
jgi:hemolysin activation/secretion protein